MLRVEGWSNQVRYVRSGWDMAERITPLLGVRWEEALDKPLHVWRQELNIEPIGEGQNSWYTVLSDLCLRGVRPSPDGPHPWGLARRAGSAPGFCSSGVEQALHQGSARVADHAIHNATVPEQENRRRRPDVVPGGELRPVVDVDFGQRQPSRVSLDYLREDRRDSVAHLGAGDPEMHHCEARLPGERLFGDRGCYHVPALRHLHGAILKPGS